MIGPTLALYFTRKFGVSLLIMLASCIALIAAIDLVEMLRRVGDTPAATAPMLMLLTLARAPALAEQMLPFAILFAAMGAFLTLSRKLEFVVTRAAGVSVWQFLAPVVGLTALVGALTTTVYNPGAAAMKEFADSLEGQIFGTRSLFFRSLQNEVWLRQSVGASQAVINARAVTEGGRRLTGVIVIRFDGQGRLAERIEAQSARLEDRAWILDNVQLHSAGSPRRTLPSYRLDTSLSADQVRDALVRGDTVAFWDLPTAIRNARDAGLSPARFELQYQGLLARPVMFVAMVVIAAAVSLRFFRIGGVAPMILGGVAAGFLLYVSTELAEDLAAAEMLYVVPAAWGPAAIGVLLGFMVLLHQEDG